MLTVTSYPNRTSPVLRGKWVLENFLGAAAAAAARRAAAPRQGPKARPRTVRERMEQHRRNPVCASCHAPMDPLGFALENFDADRPVARDRGRDARSIASGVLADGNQVRGPRRPRAAC